jgi:hypothetical protein
VSTGSEAGQAAAASGGSGELQGSQPQGAGAQGRQLSAVALTFISIAKDLLSGAGVLALLALATDYGSYRNSVDEVKSGVKEGFAAVEKRFDEVHVGHQGGQVGQQGELRGRGEALRCAGQALR